MMRRALLLAIAVVASTANAESYPAAASASTSSHGRGRASPMSRGHLSRILYTVLEDEPTFRHLREMPASEGEEASEGAGGERRLRGHRPKGRVGSVRASDPSDEPRGTIPSEDEVWDRMTRHGWDRVRTHTGSSSRRRLEQTHESGFIVCNSSPNESGHERLGSLLSLLELNEERSQVLYNTDDESCFLLSTSAEAVHSLLYDSTGGDATGGGEGEDISSSHLTVMPMLDLLKLPSQTALSLLEDDWSPDLSTLTKSVVVDEFSYEETSVEEESVDLEGWRRSILVDLLPSPEGEASSGSTGEGVVQDVIDHVANLSDPTSKENTTATTLREAFSLTAVHLGEHGRMFERHSIWSRALELGFESDHGCGGMLDGMEVRTRRGWGEESLDDSIGGFEGTLYF